MELAHLEEEIGRVTYALGNYYALNNEPTLAIDALKKAKEYCTWPFDSMEQDEDLSSLRENVAFQAFLKELEEKK